MFRKTLKKILKSDAVREAACWLGAQYIRLVWATGRWTVEGRSIPAAYWEAGKPFILSFWHGHLLMMPRCWQDGKPMHMLISQHRDGQIIARVIGHFGLGTAAGSSTRGGSAALRQMLKALKAGEYVGITPDGPRGPRMRATAGIVNIARLSGAPVIPCACSARRRKVLSSWDRFQVMLPFSTGLILWGEPLFVEKGLDEVALEERRQDIEDAMNDLARQVEIRMGHPPTEPAPAQVVPVQVVPVRVVPVQVVPVQSGTAGKGAEAGNGENAPGDNSGKAAG